MATSYLGPQLVQLRSSAAGLSYGGWVREWRSL